MRDADFGPGKSIVRPGFRPLLGALVVAFALRPGSLLACAACFGQSDSPMAQGMNWGIMSLMVMIAGVLGCFVAFFVFLARRAASVSVAAAAPVPARAIGVAGADSRRFPGALGLAAMLPVRRRSDPLLENTRSRL